FPNSCLGTPLRETLFRTRPSTGNRSFPGERSQTEFGNEGIPSPRHPVIPPPRHFTTVPPNMPSTALQLSVSPFSGTIPTVCKDGKIFLDDKLPTADIGISMSPFTPPRAARASAGGGKAESSGRQPLTVALVRSPCSWALRKWFVSAG